jgi:hypothetical protein
VDHQLARQQHGSRRVPGHVELSDRIEEEGYPLREIAGGSRILPHALHQPVEIVANGELIPVRQGSTKPVSMMVYGAGPHQTRRFEFPAPQF